MKQSDVVVLSTDTYYVYDFLLCEISLPIIQIFWNNPRNYLDYRYMLPTGVTDWRLKAEKHLYT